MKRHHPILTAVYLLLGMALFTACEKSEALYSTSHACNFVYRGDYHRGSALLRTMDNPGLYAIVTSSEKSGITHLTVTLNDNATTETIPLTTEIERRYNYAAMGANRALIIGSSNFNGWKAYDRQCRHCLDKSSSTNFPLTFSDNGRNVTCAKCKSTYALETGSSADGYRLYEYRVRFDGSVITVNNQ